MIDIGPGVDREPEVTAIEGSKKSWLILLVYAALALVLGRITWTQIAPLLERLSGFQFQSSDVPVLVLLAVFVFLIVRIGLSLRNFINSLRLDQNGQVSKAVVINKWRKSSSEDEDYWMAFEYGDGWRAKLRLNRKSFQSVSIGDEIMVEYLPEHPEISRVRQEE
ncbi:MAG: hypothetical protein PVH60_06665 [Anaerolineales bacterium]